MRKCIQERIVDPNPTHYSKFDKHIVKTQETDWSEIRISRVCVATFAIGLLLPIACCSTIGCERLIELQ